jgi:glycosyltransferase XagB
MKQIKAEAIADNMPSGNNKLRSIFLGISKKSSENKPDNFVDLHEKKMMGNGIRYKGDNFVTHSNLHHKHSAIQTFQTHQKIILLSLVIFVVGASLANLRETLIIGIAGLSLLYFIDLLFNLFLIIRSFQKSKEVEITNNDIKKIKDEDLPVYTIFCPLYKEWQVIPQFTQAISKIDWPKDKLDVQFLLEEDDPETIKEARKMRLPSYFRILIVPHGHPKTKPKACNYGLNHAKGEYAVIFDAEDIPDPDQLKKAFLTFRKLENEKIICAQAKLNFYNARQNILTRLFSAEYALWFDLVLTGLQSIKSPIPLGGTSNHFRTKDLKMLNGWDPFNVTEDCDLGIRITKMGYHTAIFNSYTMEEATSNAGNWMRQRSRWIKGYMQTYLVHMRRPHEFVTDLKNPHLITFQLVVGGKVLSMFINPVMWIVTISYFSFRAVMDPIVEPLFPEPVLYIAVFSLIFGNFLYVYYYMIGCAKRDQWDLIKYVFLVPIYWLMMSVASWKALWQLIFKPHYWEKTVHGFHLENEKND